MLQNPDGDDRRFYESYDAFLKSRYIKSNLLSVNPGEVVCSQEEDDVLAAILGSGVAVAVYDLELKLGALVYVLLDPEIIGAFPHLDDVDPDLMQDACEPLERCIIEMKQKGAGKNRIRIRLFGGSSLPDDPDDKGTKTHIFVKQYLERKGLNIVNEDLSGPFLRHLHFFPASGRAIRRNLRRDSDYDAMQRIEAEFISHKNNQ